MIDNIVFLIITALAIGLFVGQIKKISRNIGLGREKIIGGNTSERLHKLLLVAFGQQKMFKRPLPAVLHGVVYVGFLVINIEVLEILIDGIFGTHRVLAFLGPVYSVLMAVVATVVPSYLIAEGIRLVGAGKYHYQGGINKQDEAF